MFKLICCHKSKWDLARNLWAITECGCLMATPQLQRTGVVVVVVLANGFGRVLSRILFRSVSVSVCLAYPLLSSFEVQNILFCCPVSVYGHFMGQLWWYSWRRSSSDVV